MLWFIAPQPAGRAVGICRDSGTRPYTSLWCTIPAAAGPCQSVCGRLRLFSFKLGRVQFNLISGFCRGTAALGLSVSPLSLSVAVGSLFAWFLARATHKFRTWLARNKVEDKKIWKIFSFCSFFCMLDYCISFHFMRLRWYFEDSLFARGGVVFFQLSELLSPIALDSHLPGTVINHLPAEISFEQDKGCGIEMRVAGENALSLQLANAVGNIWNIN